MASSTEGMGETPINRVKAIFETLKQPDKLCKDNLYDLDWLYDVNKELIILENPELVAAKIKDLREELGVRKERLIKRNNLNPEEIDEMMEKNFSRGPYPMPRVSE